MLKLGHGLLVEKRSVTLQGKTWAASVEACPADVAERLASLVAGTDWTGGGEVEFVQDSRGHDWLIDFNPRFEGWAKHKIAVGQRRRMGSGRRRIGAGRCLTYDSRRSEPIARRSTTADRPGPMAVPNPPSLPSGLLSR